MEHPAWIGPPPAEVCEPTDWTVGEPVFAADTFDRPRRASPWAGHRWFAYDLVAATKPGLIVELGTHYGCSLFAFCQSVVDHQLATKIVAVDTWEGDPHAGAYEGVYELVQGWIGSNYSSVDIELKRMTFDDAERDFTGGPIDLLHIDGFHSYEAAQHDYESWAHRLSDTATVLFHDVDPDSGYGSAQYWQDLAGANGGFTFSHSFGLGVLTRNPHLQSLLASSEFAPTARYYAANAARDLAVMQVEDLTDMVAVRDEAVAAITTAVDARDATIASMNEMIDERDAAIASMGELIDDRDATIASMTTMINDRDAAIASMTAMIDDRDAAIASMTAMIDERDATIASLCTT